MNGDSAGWCDRPFFRVFGHGPAQTKWFKYTLLCWGDKITRAHFCLRVVFLALQIWYEARTYAQVHSTGWVERLSVYWVTPTKSAAARRSHLHSIESTGDEVKVPVCTTNAVGLLEEYLVGVTRYFVRHFY